MKIINKNMFQILVLFVFIMLNTQLIFANDNIFNDYNMQPEVWHPAKPQFNKVDTKGDLNLQIPIMTVPGRNSMDFPIVFNYHSGITVFQSASWVGLGWSWDPGSVTRDVKGAVIAQSQVMGVDFPNSTDEYANDIYYSMITLQI